MMRVTLLALLVPWVAFADDGPFDIPEVVRLPSDGVHFGEQVLRHSGVEELSDDGALRGRVQALAQRILDVSGHPSSIVQTYVSDDSEPTALATVGGVVVVSRGLLERLTEAELAFVIAHEIAHVLHRHTETQVVLRQALAVAVEAPVPRRPWSPLTPADQRLAPVLPDVLEGSDLETDSDSDGIPDSVELLLLGTDAHRVDTDGGGLSDGEELLLGTDPRDPRDDDRARLDVLLSALRKMPSGETRAPDGREREPQDQQRAPGSDRPEASALRLAQRSFGGFSQLMEAEADLYGMLWLVRAGYSPEASQSALRRLLAYEQQELGRAHSMVWRVESSHPALLARIASLERWEQSLRDSVGHFDDAAAFCGVGAWEEADIMWRMFLANFPQSAPSWTNRAICALHAASDLSGAPMGMDMGLPLHGTPNLVLSRSALHPEWLDVARSSLARARALDPDDPLALAAAADLARWEQRPHDALLLMERAREIAPDEPWMDNALAVARAAGGELDAARATLRRLQRAEPTNAVALSNLALVERARGRVRAAERYQERVDALCERTQTTLADLAPGIDANVIIERFGVPSRYHHRGSDTLQTLSWDALGLSVDVRNRTAVALSISGDSPLNAGGVRLGDAREAVIARVGPPNARGSLLGHVQGEWWAWPARGLRLTLDEQHRVTFLSVVAPR